MRCKSARWVWYPQTFDNQALTACSFFSREMRVLDFGFRPLGRIFPAPRTLYICKAKNNARLVVFFPLICLPVWELFINFAVTKIYSNTDSTVREDGCFFFLDDIKSVKKSLSALEFWVIFALHLPLKGIFFGVHSHFWEVRQYL